jgi:UDP-glucose 4-epimerase
VSDVAPVIAQSVTVPGARNEIFNIGAEVPFSVNHLAQAVARALEQECNVRHLDTRKEVKFAFSDHSKVTGVFGERAKVSLEAGLATTVEWVKSHGARESSAFDGIEILKNLPPSWTR